MKEPGKDHLPAHESDAPETNPGGEHGHAFPPGAERTKASPAVPKQEQNVPKPGFSWGNVLGTVVMVLACAAFFFGKIYLNGQKTPPDVLKRNLNLMDEQVRKIMQPGTPVPSGNPTFDRLQRMTSEEKLAWIKAHGQPTPEAGSLSPAASPNP